MQPEALPCFSFSFLQFYCVGKIILINVTLFPDVLRDYPC